MRVTKFLAGTCLFVATPALAQTAPADTSPQGAAPQPPVDANGAQTPQEAGTDDIIVTAQRRDENLSRTPVAVTVISSTTLAEAQITRADDLRQAAPGL